jgi:secreted trypsin-like serine protease
MASLLTPCLRLLFVFTVVQGMSSPLLASPRIILGNVANTFNDVPFYCTLFVEFPSDAGTFVCGCVVYAPGLVLTAAHCFQKQDENFVSASVRLYGPLSRPELLFLKPENVAVHPKYFPTSSLGDDLAFFRLPEIEGDVSVPPLVIATDRLEWDSLDPTDKLIVVGIGRTQMGFLSMGVPLATPLSRRDCAHPVGFGDLNAWDPSVVGDDLCAGPFEACVVQQYGPICQDSCSGDSGGPLFRQGNPPTLFGVVSRGTSDCGKKYSYPGIYSTLQSGDEFMRGVISMGNNRNGTFPTATAAVSVAASRPRGALAILVVALVLCNAM